MKPSQNSVAQARTRAQTFRRTGALIALALLIAYALDADETTSPAPAIPSASAAPISSAAAPTPTPGPGATPTVGPSLPTPMLSPAIDRNGLLREFVSAQKSAVAGLRHQNTMELRSLDSAQSASYREWWAKEVQKRRAYFQGHDAGKDRRAYVQDMNGRRKAFFQAQKDERARRVQEEKTKLDNEQATQARNLKDFNDSLKAGQVPPARLWPEGH